jgi:hypothetical protein
MGDIFMASLRIQIRPNSVVLFGAASRCVSRLERSECRASAEDGVGSAAEDAEIWRRRRMKNRRFFPPGFVRRSRRRRVA